MVKTLDGIEYVPGMNLYAAGEVVIEAGMGLILHTLPDDPEFYELGPWHQVSLHPHGSAAIEYAFGNRANAIEQTIADLDRHYRSVRERLEHDLAEARKD